MAMERDINALSQATTSGADRGINALSRATASGADRGINALSRATASGADRGINALSLAHKFISEHVRAGDFCIDATAGRGRDALFLAGLTGADGRVLALDIQQAAVDATNALLAENGCAAFARAEKDCHSNMAAYAAPESVDCIVFNLGWLPGGDHSVHTRLPSTLAAVEAGLALLRPSGIMSICVYYGRNNGYEERDGLLDYLSALDAGRFTVIVSRFVNRSGDPAFPVFIVKEQ